MDARAAKQRADKSSANAEPERSVARRSQCANGWSKLLFGNGVAFYQSRNLGICVGSWMQKNDMANGIYSMLGAVANN